MSSLERRGWLDRLVGTCLSLLAGAVAIFVAVRLIEAVWNTLLVIIGVLLFIGVTVTVLSRRSRGW